MADPLLAAVEPIPIAGLAAAEHEAVAQINALEQQAYVAEEEPSDLRWEQAQWVATALDAGLSERRLAGLWVNPEKGSTYGNTHVHYYKRCHELRAHLSEQGITRFNTAYNSDAVRKSPPAGKLPAPPIPEGQYGLVYADPPWRYDFAETDSRKIENQYPSMDVDEICELEVPAADNSVLYLWATAPKLREALQVVEAWEFEYLTNAVWVKDRIGMGYWFRGRHELLLVGKRGDVSPPDAELRPDSVIESPRGQHSEKPDAVYEVLERLYPDVPRLEFFARTQRPGWTSWGNEAEAA